MLGNNGRVIGGRALKNQPVADFSEEPVCRGVGR